jgi:hypothetical protein
VAGIETLSLRHSDLGSFAVPWDWTDRASPASHPRSGGAKLLIDVFGLIRLAEFFASMGVDDFEVDWQVDL